MIFWPDPLLKLSWIAATVTIVMLLLLVLYELLCVRKSS